MPNHVECCTYPVLEWIAEHVPASPVNVMAQFHPENFCDPASAVPGQICGNRPQADTHRAQ
jgi:putative pyruvate formate lyase activating enzyme